jgi:hypothetical protein
MRGFRLDPSHEDPGRLLGASGAWTEPWGDSRNGAPCDKCRGRGWTAHRCWSCVLDGRDAACAACGGRVEWEDRCPVCRGTGSVDGAPRRGVSVFPAPAGLYRYMLSRGVDLSDCVVVELEGERAPDADFDADEGAVLMVARRVADSSPPDGELIARVEEAINSRR